MFKRYRYKIRDIAYPQKQMLFTFIVNEDFVFGYLTGVLYENARY